jgi:hypothetical protein
MPKYNKTFSATAITPTTSTTIGLLSLCSNLFTYLGTIFLCPSKGSAITQIEKSRPRSAVVAARTPENSPNEHDVFCSILTKQVADLTIDGAPVRPRHETLRFDDSITCYCFLPLVLSARLRASWCLCRCRTRTSEKAC